MNIGNFIFLTITFSLALLALQRTVSRRRWLSLVFMVLPIGFFAYRWALYKEQLVEWQYAAGISVALNALFWLAYGRTHPPGHKGDIVVIGMEDAE